MQTPRNTSILLGIPQELRDRIFGLALSDGIGPAPWRIIINTRTSSSWVDRHGFGGGNNQDDPVQPAPEPHACDNASTTNGARTQADQVDHEDPIQIATDLDTCGGTPTINGDHVQAVQANASDQTPVVRASSRRCSESDADGPVESKADPVDPIATAINLAATSKEMCEHLKETLRGTDCKLFFAPPTAPCFDCVSRIPFHLATAILSSAASVQWDIMDVQHCLGMLAVHRATLFDIAGDAFTLDMAKADRCSNSWTVSWDQDNPIPDGDEARLPYQTEAIADVVKAGLDRSAFDLDTLKLLESRVIEFARLHPAYRELGLGTSHH